MKTNQFICDVCGRCVTPMSWDTYPAAMSFKIGHPSNYDLKKDDVCMDCVGEFIDNIRAFMTKK